MNAAMLAGLVIGGGIWAIIGGFWPAREPLTAIVSRVGQPPDDLTRRNLDARVGMWARRHIGPLDSVFDGLRADVRILGKDANEQAGQMLAMVVLGFGWGPVVAGALAVIDVQLPWIVPVWLAVAGAVMGAVLPYRQLKQEAKRRRTDFSLALSACCDVLACCLAGGQTTKQAIDNAAAAGDGWAFSELRTALHKGYLAGRHPWDALTDLGIETGLDELTELGVALSLAGEEGAAVRTIVRRKARVIRQRLAAAIEQEGNQAAERMTMPALVLAAGFVTFWGYPAYQTLIAT